MVVQSRHFVEQCSAGPTQDVYFYQMNHNFGIELFIIKDEARSAVWDSMSASHCD
jgi:hypothetical protein